MKKRQIFVLVLAIGVLVGGFYGTIGSLQGRMVDFPIKTLTEEKLGALLGAKVTIKTIKFGLIRQVALSGLEIDAKKRPSERFFLANIKGIVFQYNFFDLLTKNFSSPPKVVLESPKLLMRSFELPEGIFQAKPEEKQAAGFLGRKFQLAVRDGEFDYPLMDKYRIGLKGVSGKLVPSGDRIEVNLTAQGSGVLRGSLKISGFIYPATNDYDLRIHFRQGGEVLLPGFLKLRKLGGTFHLKPKRLNFEKVRFAMGDLLFESRGEAVDFESSQPVLSFGFRLMLGKLPFAADLNLDLKKELISGRVVSGGIEHGFQGMAFMEDRSLRIAGVRVMKIFEFNADLDLKAASLQWSLENDPFRLSSQMAFDDWDVVSTVNLEHVNVMGTDIVAFVKFRLRPSEAMRRDKGWEFLGSLSTDYVILDTEPINDIKGTFTLKDLEVRDIDVVWGADSRLTGKVSPIEPKSNRLTLGLREIDLGNLKRLFFYQKPNRFGGYASGKIDLRGPFVRPYISGDIEVRDGSIGNVNYKAAYLRFAGYYPYLRLSDSQLVRGKGHLYLRGDLNLRALNIFQDLEVVSEDQIVVWRGLILSKSLDENLVMIGEGIKRKMTE